MKRHQHKLGKRLLLRLVILSSSLAIISFLVVSVLCSNYYTYQIIEEAYSYARTAAHYIDGDRIPGYAQTLEKDEYYYEVETFLNSVISQQNSDIRFFYVYVPCEDDYIYIWDAHNDENTCNLGDREAYMVKGKEATLLAFQSNPKEKLYVVNDDVYGNIASAYYPIFDSQGEPVAVVAVDLFVNKLRGEQFSVQQRLFFIILLIVTLFSIVIYGWFGQQVVRPIVMLKRGMQIYRRKMNSDEASLTLDKVHLTNEIGALTGGFIALMVSTDINTAKVAKLSAEQEHIRAELNIATKMQADMLPCVFPAFPDRKEFELFACMHPAKEVGGDFYDFFLIDDDHLALVMADVSGKGIPAALFMVITRTLIKNRALMGGTPAQILADVNTQLCQENKSGMFVTVWLAILEISTGKGMAANAGHENPVLRRAGGSYELVLYRHSPVLARFTPTNATGFPSLSQMG